MERENKTDGQTILADLELPGSPRVGVVLRKLAIGEGSLAVRLELTRITIDYPDWERSANLRSQSLRKHFAQDEQPHEINQLTIALSDGDGQVLPARIVRFGEVDSSTLFAELRCELGDASGATLRVAWPVWDVDISYELPSEVFNAARRQA
jgi:hypothetical protein